MSPTTTDGLPPVIACASGAWICTMSHCSPDRLSLSVAGALPGSGPASAVIVVIEPAWRSRPSPPRPRPGCRLRDVGREGGAAPSARSRRRSAL